MYKIEVVKSIASSAFNKVSLLIGKMSLDSLPNNNQNLIFTNKKDFNKFSKIYEKEYKSYLESSFVKFINK